MRVFSQRDGRCLDQIRLQDMQVRCTIGLYPEEELRTQALTLQIALYLDTRTAARDGRLASTVDYATLTSELNFILQHSRFRLLESAAEALASYILSEPAGEDARARIEAVELEIAKPEALRGQALPSIRIFRQERVEAKGALIFAAPEAALLRFVLPPRSSQRLAYEDWHLRAFLPTESGLSIDGREMSASEVVCHEHLELNFVSNPSDAPRRLLGIASRERQQRNDQLSAQLGSVQSLYN